FFRDQFTISTWLALGALCQATLFLLFGRLAFLPALLLILYRTADTFLMAVGVKRNHELDGVILKKFSAQYPDTAGNFGNTPANQEIVVFLIGGRINHPLGVLAPGARDLGGYFGKMNKELELNADKYGYLGASNWLSNGERSTTNENLTVMYFRSIEHLHAFAVSPLHRAGWNWWNRFVVDHPHLSIWHEMYAAPAGRWESIYINSHATLLAGAAFRSGGDGEGKGEERWVAPIVDASKGALRSSRGRLSGGAEGEGEGEWYGEKEGERARESLGRG
ncbi:uncharacterized protein K441DRAFT_579923, partial [Cenococcum geophilum 1.58]|uniref:uncharacterized protein n=1 Tax=Cenococcum geophilum 1.58 TaxID=794803 RepID=UPI00358F1C57